MSFTLLGDTMRTAVSHRKGFIGKIANRILAKLFSATRSFLDHTLATQDHINRTLVRELESLKQENQALREKFEHIDDHIVNLARRECAKVHAEIAAVHDHSGNHEMAYRHWMLALRYDTNLLLLDQKVKEAFARRTNRLLKK